MAAPRAQLFTTCLADLLYPEVAERLVCLLERLGCEVTFPGDQTCCGQFAWNTGYEAETLPLALHTIEVFSRDQAPLVAPFGSCVHMLRHHYPRLLRDRPDDLARARALAERSFDFATFVVDELGIEAAGGRAPREGMRVAYHDECHLLRGLGARDQPRRLLAGVEGAEVVPLEGDELCCGFGGVFSMKLPQVSAAMADERIDRVLASGAEALVTTDVGCMMHLRGRLRRRGEDLPVLHLLELLQPEAEL